MDSLPTGDRLICKSLILSLLFLFVSRLYLITCLEINWDEFNFLAHIYSFTRGEELRFFQSLHVYLFSWLPSIPGDEITQIIVARYFMTLLQVVTGVFLYKIARKYFSLNTSLFAVFSYFSFSFVVLYGLHFRFDPIITFLMVSIIYLMLSAKEGLLKGLSIGLLLAMSLLVSVKSVIYFPILGVIIFLNYKESTNKSALLKNGLYVSLFLISVFVLLGVIAKNGTFVAMIRNFYVKFFDLFTDVFGFSVGKFDYFYKALVVNIVFWIFLVAGTVFTFFDIILKRSTDLRKCIFLLSCMIPVVSIYFYRNSYPYYYVFAMAPAALLCAVAWDRWVEKNIFLFKYFVVIVTIAMFIFVNVFVSAVRPFIGKLSQQKQMLYVIHQIFPDPVAYIDRNSMVPSFMKKGFFMSTWGFETYHENQRPVLLESIERDQPKFLLVNRDSLDFEAEGYDENVPEHVRLFPEDKMALRDNYIHHWGKLYVPGKHFEFTSERVKENFVIKIEGFYTVESTTSVVVDGELIHPLEFVYLNKGDHVITSVDEDKQAEQVTLRWGKRIMRPEPLAEEMVLYSFF